MGSALGFEPVDLSSLDDGWHTFAASTPVSHEPSRAAVSAARIERGEVRELELWAQRDHAVTRPSI